MGTPQNVGAPFNDKRKNSVLGFSSDGAIIYLYGLYSEDNSAPKTQGLSFSIKRNGKWSFPQKLDIKYFRNYSENQDIFVSDDGTIMILALQSFDTKGAEDLYVSFLNIDGSWSEPKNLGNVINTEFQEVTPYLLKDNKNLFFSSNGHDGFGSKDVFVSTRLDDSWTNWSVPENLGSGINTSGMETSLFFDPSGDFVYLVSTHDSDGYGDIKKVDVKPEDIIPEDTTTEVVTRQVVAQVIKKDSAIIHRVVENKLISFRGSLRNKKDKTLITEGVVNIALPEDKQVIKKIETNSGYFDVSLKEEYEDQKVLVRVVSPGFMPEEKAVYLTSDSLSESIDVLLNPLEVGSTIQLNNVLFKRGTATMLTGSYDELDLVVQMLKENPNMKIKLSGHTDNRGNPKLNLKLSEERVDRVIEYLTEKGIQKSRMNGKGYGGSQPIASNATEATRRLNRRVEFTIIKN
ncbi:OmpA family protein [Mangrovivirga cuniculi]|uniref:OmpA-like domain-containing protein n=1 Tax=Mangrovivirga cuniculi TaxID=2715131 RepID=A0A4D7JKP5_9BACT|nr:OmpA family protein [Mangrovivirga cuniculi]QCK15493.1 hypothetical protein DCC35_12440 [Mangrovivirga cuniculi]